MASAARRRAKAGHGQATVVAGAEFLERALAALHALAEASGGGGDPAALAARACARTRELLGVRHVTLLIWEEGEGALLALASTRRDAAALAQLRIAPGDGVSGAAFTRNAPVVAGDYSSYPAPLSVGIAAGAASAAAVPLRAGGRAIGVLAAWSTAAHAFQPDALRFLALIATQIGPAVELARLAAESDRRRVEAEARAAALAASEAGLRTVFDAMACGVNVRAADGRLLYANEASRAILGEAQAEDGYADRRDRWDVLDQHGAPLQPDQFPHSIALRMGEAVRDAVVGVRNGAGERRWLRASAVPYPITDGSGVAVVNSFLDITEQHQAAAALREAEARYRGIFENAVEGIFRCGPDGRLEAINPAGAAILGYASPADALSAAAPLPAMAADPVVREELSDRLRGGGVLSEVEFRLRRADGRVIWVSLTARTTPADGGMPASAGGIVEGLFSDISARKLAEEALAQAAQQTAAQKAELESILANLSDGLLLADERGRVWLMNPAARALFDLPAERDPDELLRRCGHWQFFDADGRALPLDELPLARAGRGERIAALDLTAEIAGRRRIVSVSAAPLRTPDGRRRGAVLTLRDVTEGRQQLESAAQSERLRALGEMASGVAHNFNNLLAVILGRCEILIGGVDGSDAGRLALPHAEVIKQAALDGAETVKRLQTFSGVNRARPAEAMDLGEIVRGVVEFTRPRWRDAAQQAGITIQVETAVEPLPLLAGNPADLREVLVNLVFNAVQAMPEGGTIRLSARRRGDEVLLQVRDTGTGMDEAVRRRVFEPFFTTRAARGHGLGLSVSYAIVERLGGRLSVESAPAAGATFTIALPFRLYEQRPAVAAPSTSRILSLLLVDDEPEIVSTTALLLELEGHRVAVAGSGAEALRLVQARAAAGRPPFDALLTDLGMPEMNGLQLIAALRAAGQALPCLLVTGWGAQLSDEDVRAAGARAVLPKPFSAADLRAALAAHVRPPMPGGGRG